MKLIKISFFILIIFCQLLTGQSFQELQKLQNEYKNALERQSLQKPKDISDAEKIVNSGALPDKLVYSRKDIESLLVNTDKLLQQLKFYDDSLKKMPYIGYDFFTKRDSISFWQNLPISKDYILGPGDEVIIALWGESSSYNSQIINRDGQIFIENIGILNLGGKSLPDAKNYIISTYSRVYSTLIGQNPKSFLDLSLGELKSVNVHFVGFVNIPGVHTVHPFSNIISGLIQAGGVEINGSLREIVILRDNKDLGSIDLYNYLIKGKILDDIRLMDQDIVFIPPRKSTIPITGRVLRPGYYEMLNNEDLSDLIALAGGKNRNSTKKIFIYKNNFFDKSGYMIDYDNSKNFQISQGDSIHLPLMPSFDSFVKIDGQIKKPGKYPFNDKMTLNELLMASTSLEDEDFNKTMDLSKIKVYRKNPSNKNPIALTIGIEDDFNLKNGDHITIPKSNLLEPIEAITITGEIMNPGIYPVNNTTSLKDVLSISGGFTHNALNDGVEVFRDSLKIAWEKEDFLLLKGDSLNVLKKSGLVLVKGEVNVPGYVSFKKNTSARQYLKKAGGLTSYAEKKNIYVIYPNGTSVPFSSWSSPRVREGSTIVVGQRSFSSQQQLSGLEIFASISDQAGSIATTLLSLSILLSQQNNAN